MFAAEFEKNAPTSADEAATVILDAVREQRWRVLIGRDAEALDEAVRRDPEGAYEGPALIEVLRDAGGRI